MKQIILTEKVIEGKTGCEMMVEGFERLETILILNGVLHNEIIDYCNEAGADKEQFLNSLKECLIDKKGAKC